MSVVGQPCVCQELWNCEVGRASWQLVDGGRSVRCRGRWNEWCSDRSMYIDRTVQTAGRAVSSAVANVGTNTADGGVGGDGVQRTQVVGSGGGRRFGMGDNENLAALFS